MSYAPTNPVLFSAAYASALMGMAYGGGRVSLSTDPATYAAMTVAAGQWAIAFDTVWDDEATPDTAQVFAAQAASLGLWTGRVPDSLTLEQCEDLAAAVIAAMTQAETWLASEDITPPTWDSGGGGGGGVPNVPANSAGFLLTSTNTTGTAQPASTASAWEPSGGEGIASFAKNHGTTFEVGFSDADPTFTASYVGGVLPTAADIAYTTQSGSPLTLTTPFTSGQIEQTFVETANGATATFTLQATFNATVKTSTLTDTWGLPILSMIAATGAVAATQAFLDTMRGANAPGIHTTVSGTYLTGQSVGSGQISVVAIPQAIDVGTVWTDEETGLQVSPVLVGTVPGYANPEAVVIPMNLYTVGGIGIGTVSWGLS